MKHLLIDIGNSRIKVALLNGQRFELLSEDLSLEAPTLPGVGSVERVWVSNVRRTLGVDELPMFESVNVPRVDVDWRQCAAHQQTAYVPEQLGIDRWLALLAVNAQRKPGQAALVIDLGTAVTLDVLDADGLHQGGYIVAGAGLMVNCLASETGLDASGAADIDGLPLSTATAIRGGAELAVMGALRQMMHRYPGARVFLGGGAARQLQSALDVPVTVIPQMVLSGLAELVKREKG